MKKSKFVVILSISLICSVFLTSCSGGSTSTASSEDTSTEASSSDTESTSSGGKTDIAMFTWDVNQKPSMDALAARYMEIDSNTNITIDVSSWDEYWVKLEAMANSSTLPDIAWMHTNEFSRYAEAGFLEEVTDLYADVEEDYYNTHFASGLVNNVTYDDKIYGVPKDKDSIGLIYNKDIFDEAGLAYPDDTWTWDTLKENAQIIKDKTGKYGFFAGHDDQSGYLNLVYQAGGELLNDDRTESGLALPGTQKGIGEWINWNLGHSFSPTQAELSEINGLNRFLAGEGAMVFIGSWNIVSTYNDYPDLNWDIAVLPYCPDPVDGGDGRASIYNGLSYAYFSENEKNDVIKGFVKFLGTEEASIIHGENGAAIPAYIGTEASFSDSFSDKNISAFTEMFEYGVQFPYSKSKAEWGPQVSDNILEIYNGTATLEDTLQTSNDMVNEYLANE